MTDSTLRRGDLIFPELSYIIVGCAYEVFNELGAGHSEKIYQKALAVAFRDRQVKFTEQYYFPQYFKGNLVGRFYLDFLVEERIIVEIKKEGVFTKTNIEQVLKYLKTTKFKLAILINFTKEGVKFKRVINILE